MSGFRLPTGGSGIDRLRPLSFRFDGCEMRGLSGDTLASALVGNGVTLLGRSFKYHRPRGLMATGFAEPNALVRIGEGATVSTNMPATLVPLIDGLVARSLNRWPSLRFDLGGVNDRLGGLLSAGFYYKSFMWPGWHLFEPWIRRAAGIGRAPMLPDPDSYDHREVRCDVLVIGGGAAGMAAALAAGQAGVQVMLIEADTRLGVGMLGASAEAHAHALADEIDAEPNIAVLRRTTAIGYYDHDLVTAAEQLGSIGPRERLWKIRARQVVIACGAQERPLLFANNDRPGVMLAGTVHKLIARHAVAAGKAPLFATTHDGAYAAAFAAQDAGLTVRGIVDARAGETEFAGEARRRGIALYHGQMIAHARGGGRGVRSATIVPVAGGAEQRIGCDVIAMTGGWSPNAQLFTQAGGTLRHDAELDAFVPSGTAQSARCCGAAAGVLGVVACAENGTAIGLAVAAACGFGEAPALIPSRGIWPQAPVTPPPGVRGKIFVDFQTDATVADLTQASGENYRSVEHAKRYTVWGMGIDQGRLGGANGVSLMAALQGIAPGSVGTVKARPPYAPTSIATLAAARANGPLHRPWKHLPAHGWHEAQGAVFEDFGWLRPSHYPRPGEDLAQAAAREARTVRSGVGLFDGSSLGKIEIAGAEAGVFLDRVSAGRPSTIPVGRVRYNLLLDELGTVLDDGVVARIADDRFLLSASSSHAERVVRWLEDWHQNEWPLDCVLRDVTAAWALLTLAGPRAKAVLASMANDIDFGVFSHLSMRFGSLDGIPVRIQRVSFTGEASYEIACPGDRAGVLAACLMAAGTAYDIVPFGLETLDMLRIEKGYVVVGTDTDGTTRPADIGWGGIVKREGDFIGRRSLQQKRAADGRELVGVLCDDPDVVLPVGSHVIGGTSRASQGFVTSACHSATLGRSIAIALLGNGRARHGETVTLWSEGRTWSARVVAPCFVDPQGERLDG